MALQGGSCKRLKRESDGRSSEDNDEAFDDQLRSDVMDWLSGIGDLDHPMLMLDLRPAVPGLHRLHHPNLLAVSLPLGDLKSRSFELPARCREFSVLVEEDGDEDGNSSLCRAREFLLQPDRDASNEKRKFRPWNVKRIVVANKQFWQQAKELDLLNVEALTSSPIPGQKPQPRLWESDPMVVNKLLPLLRKHLQRDASYNLRVWDMASGAGRDAVFLAEELMFALGGENRRVRVTALDQRYNNKQANVVRDFFARRGVGDISQVKKADLSKWGIMQRIMMRGDDLHHSDFELRVLFCVRFFVRTFVNDLARCSHLEHGTIFAISHFCIAREGQSWQFDHPKPGMVLQRNEMRNLVCVALTICRRYLQLFLSSTFTSLHLI